MAESAMYHASSAQMQSACLSRQVGAAVVDSGGNVVATGSNEVPKAGGGVYGESESPDHIDARCAFHREKESNDFVCRNTLGQNRIIRNLLETIPEIAAASDDRKAAIHAQLKKSPIGRLLEFSRSVHAEMDALLSAARKGVSTVGCRLFVTTFPCHYCARHIVAAGIAEVQYIEPYPKSQALSLHEDSIATESRKNAAGQLTHVLFRPFSGVAPRLYRRAFMWDRELKDKQTGHFKIQEPEWTSPWHLPKEAYIEIEAKLCEND
jgi:deoxycytidylate deaminase